MWLYPTALALLAATLLGGAVYARVVRRWPLLRTVGVGLQGAGFATLALAMVLWPRGAARHRVMAAGVLVLLLGILLTVCSPDRDRSHW